VRRPTTKKNQLLKNKEKDETVNNEQTIVNTILGIKRERM